MFPPAGAIPVPPHEWLPGQPNYDEPDGHHNVEPIATVIDEVVPSSGPKNKKNKAVKTLEPVPTSYKGYDLRKAELPGQKLSWNRVGKREIVLDDIKLREMVRRHLKGRPDALQMAYNNLSSSQQGVVNNLLDEHSRLEKNANAQWVLADVRRQGPEHFGRLTDVTKISVILRRQDKNKGVIDTKTPGASATFYSPDDIIDLQRSVKEKEKSGKAGGRKNSGPVEHARHGRSPDIFDPVNMGSFDEPVRHHQPVQQPWPEAMAPPPAPVPPQYPDPVAAMGGLPGPPPVMPPQNFNPFQPYPGVIEPLPHNPLYNPHDHHGPRAISPLPIQNTTQLRRNNSNKRLSRVENENRRLEAEVDELRDRIENFPTGSNSSGASARARARERFDSWSATDGSRTPQSSPPRSEDLFYEENRRKRSRDRNGARRNGSRYRGDRRDTKYKTAERVEIRTYAAARPRRMPGRDYDRDDYDGRRSPPRLYRAVTVQDYPLGSIGDRREPRYIAQQPALRRQLTDYPDVAPYADYNTAGRRRNSQAANFDQFAEIYQAGRRPGRYEGQYDGRRTDFVEVDRDYYP